jgi:hypothetical protein
MGLDAVVFCDCVEKLSDSTASLSSLALHCQQRLSRNSVEGPSQG